MCCGPLVDMRMKPGKPREATDIREAGEKSVPGRIGEGRGQCGRLED